MVGDARQAPAAAAPVAPVAAPASPAAPATPAPPVSEAPAAAPVASAPAAEAAAGKVQQKQKDKKKHKQKNNKKNKKILKRGLQVRPVRSRIAPKLIQQWTQTLGELGELPDIIMGTITGSDGDGHEKYWTVDWGSAIIWSHKAQDLLIVPPEPTLQCPPNLLTNTDTTPIYQAARALRASVLPRAGRGGPGSSITAAAAAAAAAAEVAAAAAAATATSTTTTTTKGPHHKQPHNQEQPRQTLEAVATMYNAQLQQSKLLRTLDDPQFQAARVVVTPASELREYLSPVPSRSLRLTVSSDVPHTCIDYSDFPLAAIDELVYGRFLLSFPQFNSENLTAESAEPKKASNH
jgi:hypothetical protein